MTALLGGTSANRCVCVCVCFIHLFSRLSGEERSETASRCRANVSLIRGENNIHKHTAMETQQQKPESRCLYSTALQFNILYSVICFTILTKILVMRKCIQYVQTHTFLQNEREKNGSTWACLYTLRNTFKHHWSHNKLTHSTQMHVHTHTLAIRPQEPSLINMQSIIHTFIISVPFLWQT